MPEATPRSDDWKMLTLVGLADRLAARTSVGKDQKANDARKNRWAASKSILRYILNRLKTPGKQAAAIRGLRDLDEAYRKAIEGFSARAPDAKLLKAPAGAQAPAAPEDILKAYCHVALRARATCTRASISDIIWHSFRQVVAPQIAAYLQILEKDFPKKESWPRDQSAKGADETDKWNLPSALLSAVRDGHFERRLLQSSGPALSLTEFKNKAEQCCKGEPTCRAKAAVLLRVLLQFCADNEADWTKARSMAGVILQSMEAYGQQVLQCSGVAAGPQLVGHNMADFIDAVCAPIIAELGKGEGTLDRTINLPQTRRRILAYANLVTTPSYAELDMDFSGSVKSLRERIKKENGDSWASACMGYASYMRGKCLIDSTETPESQQASELTYELMERAFETGNPDTQQIALRYLAGFTTNPRFRCTALAQHKAKEWIGLYKKTSPKGMSHLFLGRLAFINGDTPAAIGFYQRMFVRALPKEFSDEAAGVLHPIEDHEALAYLIPECYALAGIMLSNEKQNADEESELQKQIRRAGVAHFGIVCEWPKEAKRIMAGFEYRKGLLTGRVTPKS
jgi:hypothetical protein